MSDVIEKTLASLPKFLGGSLMGVASPTSPKHTTSRGFQSFLRAVNKAKSKQDEELLVYNEIQEMQHRLSQTDTTKQQTCDCLCRAIYCCMLGYEVSKINIYAVKLAQQGTGFEKKMGYLASSLLLHENHDLVLLLINTIQKDLQSTNLLDNCAALVVICQLINTEHIPSVLPLVQKKLHHSRELVRMRAATCIHHFLQKLPPLADNFRDDFQQILFDKDPGVMSMGVNICKFLVERNPEKCPDLAESLLGILQQIIARKLSKQFEFHSVPLPWLQIQILKTLAILGKVNASVSEKMYPVLKDILQRTNMKERIAFAVMYECIVTISQIPIQEGLLQEAVTCTGRFMRSANKTLQYIGIKCLTALVKSHPQAALDHQLLVVELLEDPDKAIQQKTLELLYNMANSSNVQVICDKLLDHVTQQEDNKFRQTELVTMVMELADKFNQSDQWYVDTIFRLLQICKSTLPQSVVNKAFKVIQTGCRRKDDSTEGKEFKQYLVKRSLETLKQDNVSPELIKIASWVTGEFASLLKNLPEDKVVSLVLRSLSDRALDVAIKLWVTNSLTKLVCAGLVTCQDSIEKLKVTMATASDVLLQQKLCMAICIAENKAVIDLPSLNSETSEEDQLDLTLSFLDDFISASMDTGTPPYRPKYMRNQGSHGNQRGQFVGKSLFAGVTSGHGGESVSSSERLRSAKTKGQGSQNGSKGSTGEASADSSGPRESTLNMKGVKRVWGRQGFEDSSQHAVDVLGRELEPRSETKSSEGSVTVEGDLDIEPESEVAKRKALASALFEGVSSSSVKTSRENSMLQLQASKNSDPLSSWQSESRSSGSWGSKGSAPKPLPKTDTGGWRNLHSKNSSKSQDGLSDMAGPNEKTPEYGQTTNQEASYNELLDMDDSSENWSKEKGSNRDTLYSADQFSGYKGLTNQSEPFVMTNQILSSSDEFTNQISCENNMFDSSLGMDADSEVLSVVKSSLTKDEDSVTMTTTQLQTSLYSDYHALSSERDSIQGEEDFRNLSENSNDISQEINASIRKDYKSPSNSPRHYAFDDRPIFSGSSPSRNNREKDSSKKVDGDGCPSKKQQAEQTDVEQTDTHLYSIYDEHSLEET